MEARVSLHFFLLFFSSFLSLFYLISIFVNVLVPRARAQRRLTDATNI